MPQYIDKNKIELEIKKHKLFAKDARNYAEENDDDIEIAVNEEVVDVCSSLLSFLDTLEVKEEVTTIDDFIERAEKYLENQFIEDVSVLAGGIVQINFTTEIKNFVNYMKQNKT